MARKLTQELLIGATCVMGALMLGGCAGTMVDAHGGKGDAPSSGGMVFEDVMVPEGTTVLSVNGMSCPLCVTNVDEGLEKLPGVSDIRTDLSNGTVSINVTGEKRPTLADLNRVVSESGFTLTKISR
jgi:copper chaperone CopZ